MNWAGELRNDLRKRALSWASSQSIDCYESLGEVSTVLFPTPVDKSSHGNFHLNSWRAIQESDIWVNRLDKVHTQATRALPIEMQAGARELDSSNSSDALLMNCFCFPGAAARIMSGLALMQLSPEIGVVPEFGVKARLPLLGGREDTTEVDMRIGPYIFEAKLTERNFTTADEELIRRYSAFESTFEVTGLKREGSQIKGYQLIRNVLAAVHLNASLIVLVDQRRPDLLQEWWETHAAIKDPGLRLRCGFRTWQQVAASSPPLLGEYLSTKYGL
jgi:hypothetical protein